MRVGVNRKGTVSELCHMPPKPRANTAIYEDTAMHIVVARSRCSGVRWWDLVCLGTRGGNECPSVLDRPLRHLSAYNQRVAAGPEQCSANPPSRISDSRCRVCSNRLPTRASRGEREFVSDLSISHDHLRRFSSRPRSTRIAPRAAVVGWVVQEETRERLTP